MKHYSFSNCSGVLWIYFNSSSLVQFISVLIVSVNSYSLVLLYEILEDKNTVFYIIFCLFYFLQLVLQINERSSIFQWTLLQAGRTITFTHSLRTFRAKRWTRCFIDWSAFNDFFCSRKIALTFVYFLTVVRAWRTILDHIRDITPEQCEAARWRPLEEWKNRNYRFGSFTMNREMNLKYIQVIYSKTKNKLDESNCSKVYQKLNRKWK